MASMLFSDEHEIFRDAFRAFVAAEVTPNVEEWERQREVPRELWLKMGEQGFLCPWLPEEDGGLGIDFGAAFFHGPKEQTKRDTRVKAVVAHGTDVAARHQLGVYIIEHQRTVHTA